MVKYMQFFFIRESTTKNLFKRIFKTIEVKQNVIILNYHKIKKKNINYKKRVIREILKKLNYYDCKKVILSKQLKQDNILKQILYDSNNYIINGEYLFKILLEKIIEKASTDNNIKSENSQITIISNTLENWLESFLENSVTKFKILTIVTENSIIFKKLENKFLEKEGTILAITNNKKKSLSKSNIIINLSLNEEQFNKYNIFENSIIINAKGNIKIHKKRFNGKIINGFQIALKKDSKIYRDLEKEEYSYFDIIDLAEVYILNNPKEISNISIKFLKK